MIENFEFSDTKQVRKTLLITSFIGISFKYLVKFSKGDIEFFGFKIPVQDANIIPKLAGFIILYEIIVLTIRYLEEKNKENKKKYKDELIDYKSLIDLPDDSPEMKYLKIRIKIGMDDNRNTKRIDYLVIFIDFLFPVLFGFFALIKIFVF